MRNRLFILFVSIIIFSLFFPVPIHAFTSKGYIEFIDNFEDGNFSKWTEKVTTGGSITSDGDVSTKNAYFNYTNSAGYLMLSKDLPQINTANVKVFFYDDGAPTKGTMIAAKDITKGLQTGVGVVSTVSSSNYVVRINTSNIVTNKTRSMGWHMFDLITDSTGTKIFIDGVQMSNVNTSMTNVGQVFIISSWATGTAKYHDLIVVNNAKSAPCTNTTNDSFSSLDSWTVTMDGNLNTVNTNVFDGKNILDMNYNNPSGYNFVSKTFCQSAFGRYSIKFYDDLKPGGVLFALYSDDLINPTQADKEMVGIGVWTALGDNNYYLEDRDTYIYRVGGHNGPDKHSIPTAIKRTLGWHTFEIVSTPVGAYGVLDGINLTWLNGKKNANSFTYDIAQEPGFLSGGGKSIGIATTWNSGGRYKFADFTYTPLSKPNFNYSTTSTSMASAASEMAMYYFNNYPRGYDINFFNDLLKETDKHFLGQINNFIASTSMVLAYDGIANNNSTSLNRAVNLFTALVNNGYIEKTSGCNSQPYFMNQYITAYRLLWNNLDANTKKKFINQIMGEADYWLNVRFSTTTNTCTNPWGNIGMNVNLRDTLPFARQIGTDVIWKVNSATRDNAWTAGFFKNAATLPEIKLYYPSKAASYDKMSLILAYATYLRNGDPELNLTNPVTNEVIKNIPTVLDNFDDPTAWSNPNPYYTYQTMEQFGRTLLPYFANNSLNNLDSNYFHNWANMIAVREKYIDFNQFRAKSSVEGVTYTMPKITNTNEYVKTSFDYYGKAHQKEDFYQNTDTLAILTTLPSSKTGIDAATISRHRTYLYNMLKYQYFIYQGRMHYPYFETGIPTAGVADPYNMTYVPYEGGWGKVIGSIETWPGVPSTTPVLLTTVFNSIAATNLTYTAMILNPPAQLKFGNSYDLNKTDKASCFVKYYTGSQIPNNCSDYLSIKSSLWGYSGLSDIVSTLKNN